MTIIQLENDFSTQINSSPSCNKSLGRSEPVKPLPCIIRRDFISVRRKTRRSKERNTLFVTRKATTGLSHVYRKLVVDETQRVALDCEYSLESVQERELLSVRASGDLLGCIFLIADLRIEDFHQAHA